MPAAINWTPQLETSVIEAIEAGDSLRKVADSNGLYAASAILKHRDTDESFKERYTRALEIRGDADFEQLADEISVEPERGKFGVDPGWANWQRTRIDTLKWIVA